jgi:hypothetical protein
MTGSEQIKPIEDVRDISAITYGFMASKALFAALDFDLFTHIARGIDTSAALAEATGIPENRLLTLLAALKSLGVIAENGGRLNNAPATAKFLVAGAPGDFRDYVRLVNGAFGYESFRHLSAALRGERIFPDKCFYDGLIYSSGIGGDQFSSAQHSGSLGPARLMTKRVDLGGRQQLLDVGGGSGAYTLAFCAANPGLKATILDFPQTVETAKKYAQQSGLTDRVRHLAGNATVTGAQEQDTQQRGNVPGSRFLGAPCRNAKTNSSEGVIRENNTSARVVCRTLYQPRAVWFVDRFCRRQSTGRAHRPSDLGGRRRHGRRRRHCP